MMKMYVVLLSMLLLAITVELSSANTFSIDGLQALNVEPDWNTTSIFLNTTEAGTITDLDLTLVMGDADKSNYPSLLVGMFTDDLTITLVHDSVSAKVYVGNGSNVQNVFINATFDDEASNVPLSSGSVVGTVLPNPNLLNAFDGKQLSGTWELQIRDTNWPSDGTDLIAWNISGTTAEEIPVPEPSTLLLLGTSLLSMGIYVRRKKVSE